MKDLAEKIKNIAVKEYNLFEDYIMKYDTISNYANDVRVRIPDCNKARIELNWTADIKVDTSIRLCLNHILKK